MSKRSVLSAAVAVVCVGWIAGATNASVFGSAAGRPGLAAGPASGFVPARNAGQVLAPLASNLVWHNGPVMHSTTVVPVFWGSSWSNTTFKGDKVTGLDYVYSHVGGTPYLHTNFEYTDSSGHVGLGISKSGDLTDLSRTPTGAPSTTAVLNEVAKVTGGHPVANAYYPVYSDQRRGSAGYCAWHSSGTINGIRVQFGFFFSLDGDSGCNPGAPTNLGHSQGLSALANVSGHELSEMLTDPRLNAWYDRQGNENADKCAWTWHGLVTIGSQQWKIQGNWSNAAANAGTGYANVGCIQTS
jgi:hypothetical protein